MFTATCSGPTAEQLEQAPVLAALSVFLPGPQLGRWSLLGGGQIAEKTNEQKVKNPCDLLQQRCERLSASA